jgi:hydrogenase maturation factor
MTKIEAIYNGFIEICPFTNYETEVEVQVEDGKDDYGDYVIVHWNNIKSSKIRYK